jgi:hypothetical protein
VCADYDTGGACDNTDGGVSFHRISIRPLWPGSKGPGEEPAEIAFIVKYKQ